MKLFLDWIHSFIQFIKRNPVKLGIFAVISLILAVFYQYSIKNPLLTSSTHESSSSSTSQTDRDGFGWGGKSKKAVNNNKMMKNAQRSRLLLRIRKQFDLACKSFLPTLRRRIFETIDINNTIRQIKDLRTSGKQSTDLEGELWEDVKISSFGQMFTTIYLLSAVCTLLRIQLHVLARHLIKTEKNSSTSSTSSGNVSVSSREDGSDDGGLDSEMFRLIVEGTYRQMFGKGIQSFSVFILEKLRVYLRDWTVKEKVKVEYEEIHDLFEKIRKQIELHFDLITKELFLRKDFD